MEPDTIETDLQGFIYAENEDFTEQIFSISGEEMAYDELLSE